MKCNDVRKYFNAFLDDELDVEKNIDVLAHMDMCCECSQKIERERLLYKRVRETVCAVKAPVYLAENILKRAEVRPNLFLLFVKNLLSVRRLVPVAGIVAAIMMIVYFFVIPGVSEKGDLLYLAESKYHNYMRQQPDLDIRSPNPETVAEYLRGQTNTNVVLPEIGGETELVGASLFEIDEMKISQVYYNVRGETPISVMIVCSPDSKSGSSKKIDFSSMQEKSVNGRIAYYDEGYCGHCQILGWEDAGNQYVAVAALTGGEIVKLLKISEG